MKDLFQLKREFLEYCELDKGQSALTIGGYDRYLSRFLEWLKQSQVSSASQRIKSQNDNLKFKIEEQGANNNPTIQQSNNSPILFPEMIDQEAVRQYKLYVNRLRDHKDQELKKSTQNYHILALRAFLRYLAFRGIASLAPEKVSVAKLGDREINFLNAEEIERLFAAVDLSKKIGPRDRTILEVLFSSGMRVSELVNLNIKDVNFDRGEIAVLGKGKKLRLVFLSESALKWLNQYLEARRINNFTSPVFLSPRGRRMNARAIERIVERLTKKAGILKRVSPHTLRHSFATDLLIAGADVRSVQSLLGHSSITTTQVYTHLTDQHLREIHQAFHGRTLSQKKVDGD